MAWFRFTLDRVTADALAALNALPGVTVRDGLVTVHENAAWLVERVCTARGIPTRATTTKEDGIPLTSVEDLVGAGLREWVPAFLTPYQRDGILATAHRDAHLWWAAGCLAGDTEVVVNRGGNARRMPLRDLVHKFNGGTSRNPRTGVETAWDTRIVTYTQSLDEKTGVLVKNRVVAAVASGVKPVFRLTTTSGESIRATGDHRFLTPRGWCKLSDLRVGDEALVESWPTRSAQRKVKAQYEQVDHMWNHPRAVRTESARSDRAVGVKRTARVATHRLVAEARMNALDLATFVGRIVLGETFGLQFLSREQHVHHADGDHRNNASENLVVLSEQEHLALHADAGGALRVAGKAVCSRIARIEPWGEEETFDLSMEDPHNNFVANGIVVHNSGKTAGAICWALAGLGATVLVTRAGVRRSHAREIERLTTHRALVIEEKDDLAKLADSEALFVVVGWEALPDAVEHLLAWRPKNVIFDECFPGDTLVSTPTGLQRIDALLPGDEVLSLNAAGEVCVQPVVRTIAKRLTGELVKVTHEDGSFVCTPNHKVWTEEDGYVEAGKLDVRHHLRVVRVGIGGADDAAQSAPALLREVVQREVAHITAVDEGSDVAGRDERFGEGRLEGAVAEARVSRADAAAHDNGESDVRPCGGREDVGGAARTPIPSTTWRERYGDDRAAGHNLSLVSVAGRGVLRWSPGIDADGNWCQTILARPGGPVEEAGRRGGRAVASDEGGPREGCPQGRDTRGSRVVAVAPVERGCAGAVGANAGADSVVFDLEVEGTHCYFANGALVSNCHKAKSWKRFGATPQENGKLKFDPLENIAQAAFRLSRACSRRLATTATPIKDRTRDLWAQLDLVHPDAWGPFYRKDRASFAARYCAAHEGSYGGIDSRGSSNLNELYDRVSLVVNQVPHSVTHRHLPPRRRLITYVTLDEQCRAEGFTATAMKKVAKNGPGAILEARLMESAAKKRKVLLDLVAECIEGKQKVVIFTGRREDCEKLGQDIEKLATGARIFVGHGGTAPSVRDDMQQQYMATGGPAVLVGTGDAWGEGCNLHDTDTAFMAFLPYTPGQVIQWEGRFSRQGQKRPVLIQYLIAEQSVDEHVAGLLLDKLPAVEDVSKDDSLEGFSRQLRGGDDEEAIVAGLLSKLGVA